MMIDFLFLATLALSMAAPEPAAEPVRMAVEVFGETAEIEVRDLPRAEAEVVVRAGLSEIFELEGLLDSKPSSRGGSESGRPVISGGLADLNSSAGRGYQIVDPRVGELLVRSQQFCVWSSNAMGPLGGRLYDLWAEAGEGLPEPVALGAAVTSAECRFLDLAAQSSAYQAAIDVHSRADLRTMAKGYSIDRAIELLRAAGVTNAWVGIGDVSRSLGGGTEGRGWRVDLPLDPTTGERRDTIFLHDQAIALVEFPDRKSSLIDHRDGVPASGVQLVVAVTELAVEAEALASVMMVTGLQGQQRLGRLEPRPSVYWVLGNDDKANLKSMYRWSELDQLRVR